MNQIKVSHISQNNLKDVSVCLPEKNVISFIGKSGSGKSTLAVDVIYAAYLHKTEGVEVFGTAALFKQISSLNNQRSTIAKYLSFDKSTQKSLSDIVFHTEGLLKQQDIKYLIKMLDISDISMNAAINSLSMTTYNKIRFLKLIVNHNVNVLIVDELAAGLNFQEASAIGEIYKFLVGKGYTIIAIEHSLPVIMHSDYIVELGPDAGIKGGEVLFCGALSDYAKTEKWRSILTKSNKQFPIQSVGKKKIEITNINYHCLKKTDIKIPLNAIVNICGKTASGKSSLLDIIFRALDKSADAWKNRYGIDGEIEGKNHIRRAYVIDQSPIGKNSMSTVATYSGVMDSIRKIYAEYGQPQNGHYTNSDFSYNGRYRCPKCNGHGYFSKIVDENELFIPCDMCDGKRYVNDILSVTICGMSIGTFLQTTCDMLYQVYSQEKPSAPVTKKFNFINSVGLSYICLGQPSGTLSGGESQRLKITKELAKKLGDRCVFILDNPTKGLNVFDFEKMLQVLRGLILKNNSIIISDNTPFMVRNADYLVVLDDGKVNYTGIPSKLPLQYQKIFGLEL